MTERVLNYRVVTRFTEFGFAVEIMLCVRRFVKFVTYVNIFDINDVARLAVNARYFVYFGVVNYRIGKLTRRIYFARKDFRDCSRARLTHISDVHRRADMTEALVV